MYIWKGGAEGKDRGIDILSDGKIILECNLRTIFRVLPLYLGLEQSHFTTASASPSAFLLGMFSLGESGGW